MTGELKKSSAGLILLAWPVVGIPLGWGVYNTLLNSMKLVPGSTGGNRCACSAAEMVFTRRRTKNL
jgi:hypothetical protein